MNGFKKRHALILLTVLAVVGLVGRVRHRMEQERDEWIRQLVKAGERIRWLEMQLARRSLPPPGQTGGPVAGNTPPPSKPVPKSNEDQEDKNGEIPAKEGNGGDKPYTTGTDPIYGPFRPSAVPMAEGRTTVAELKRLEKLPPIELGDYVLKARLLNAKGGEISAAEVRGGQRSRMEFIKEFPYPTSFETPAFEVPSFGPGSNEPPISVTPSTPQEFEFKNTGWTIDLDMSAKGGLLVVKGRSEQAAFESFTAQPGETGQPIYDESGTLLTDNKQLQPSFTTREQPFLFDMLPGKTYRLPLSSGDGGTVLELTPVPAG